MLAFDYPSRADKPIKHLVFLFIQQALITNAAVTQATGTWIITTYSPRNWVEVFYREAKGWLGLKEYQVTSLKSLHRHLILVFCAYSFIIWQKLTGGLRRRPSKQTFKDFY